MGQMLFVMLGLAGLAGLGALMSDNDDAQPPEGDEPIDLRGRELISGTDDADEIIGPNEDHALEGRGGDDTLIGGAGDDMLFGDNYEERSSGRGGDDLIDGGAGNDSIWGGWGNDTVIANPGDDLVYLGADNDLYGDYDPGADEGNDTIIGGSGDDVIITNGGRHEVYGDDNPDDAFRSDNGASGHDEIYDNGGVVTVHGGRGDDLIWSPDDSDPDDRDELYGGEGNDTIYAGGYDLVDGQDGNDLYILRADASGPAEVVWGRGDRLEIVLPEGYSGDPDLEMEQDGDDVRVLVDGSNIALLRNVNVANVPGVVFLTQGPTPPWPA